MSGNFTKPFFDVDNSIQFPYISDEDALFAEICNTHEISDSAADALIRLIKSESFDRSRLSSSKDVINRKLAKVSKESGLTFNTKVIKSGDSSFDFFHRNVLSSAIHLVRKHKSLKFFFEDSTSNLTNYGEMWTGDWWRMAKEKLPPGTGIMSLIMFSDKTQCSINNSFHPIILTLGNIPLALRKKDTSKIVIGYIPSTDDNLETLHKCYSVVLEDLKSASDFGIYIKSGGVCQTVYPLLSLTVADYQEQANMAAIYCSSNCASPCTNCNAPREELNLITKKFSKRTKDG